MAHKALRVPVSGDVEEVEWTHTGDISRYIDPPSGSLDFLTMVRQSYQVAVDDTGALDGLEMNSRATRLVREHGYRGVLFGDVVILGLTESGGDRDVPQEIIDAIRNS